MHFDATACGKRIKKARREKGLTQRELSEALYISPKYLSRIETGAQCASLEIIINIAAQLDTSVDALVLGRSNNAIPVNANIKIELQKIIKELSILEFSIIETQHLFSLRARRTKNMRELKKSYLYNNLTVFSRDLCKILGLLFSVIVI